MPRRRTSTRRTPTLVDADAAVDEVARRLGRSLRESRKQTGKTQLKLGADSDVCQSTISEMERGHGARFTLQTWGRVAGATGSSLHAYLGDVSGAELPRDHAHAVAQELVLRTALTGGWRGAPEVAIDREPSRSRSADLLLARRAEHAAVEIWDWFDDLGDTFRTSDRKIARIARAVIARPRATEVEPRVGCLWVVRETRRNRGLLAEFSTLFRSRFPGQNRAWLAALTDPAAAMPTTSGLLWISVDGKRLSAIHLATPRPASPSRPASAPGRPAGAAR